MPLSKFAGHHDQLIELADAILTLSADGSAEALTLLQTQRIALSKSVSEHCAAEIAHLPAQAREPQADPHKAMLLREYHSGLLAWRGALMECNANWPSRRIADEPGGFVRVFEKLATSLRDRVRWEEQEFYPAIFGANAVR